MVKMITINRPRIISDYNNTKIISDIVIEGSHKELWFQVENKYKDYLVTEQLDAFFIGILPYAMKSGQDIRIDGIISERLFYTVKNYLMKAITNNSFT